MPPDWLFPRLASRRAAQANLADLVTAATTAAGILPGQLSPELTETVLLQAGHSMRHDLDALTEKGVHLGLDDFGTGYASLTYFRRFPVDTVKIDRSLVSGVVDNPESRAVVSAIVSLCRGLGIPATAESVEAAEQLATLRGMGCHRAQGFYIARPQPADALTRFLTGR